MEVNGLVRGLHRLDFSGNSAGRKEKNEVWAPPNRLPSWEVDSCRHRVSDDGNCTGLREQRTNSLLSARRCEPELIHIFRRNLGDDSQACQSRPVKSFAGDSYGGNRSPVKNSQLVQTFGNLRLLVRSGPEKQVKIRDCPS
jgi:hypothetical protein